MRSLHWVLGISVVAGCPHHPSPSPQAGGSGPGQGEVRPGLEVLLSDSAHLVRGRRVGLVTNQAGVDHRGLSGVELFREAGIRLVALFSPEHGFRGTADPGAAVATSLDPATGLPIYSLYGATPEPTDSMLDGVEVMVVDLQDAGARYFTYLWTTVGVMRAAERRGIPVIVLDRPNPIGGAVQGNVLDTAFRSPVGLLAIPMRHGMTLGELALLARHDLGLGTALTVIPVAGWRRSMYFEETGLPFAPPSPNLRHLEALIHYPGLCLFEGTTLSVGRGTDAPFEQLGAPWLDSEATMRALDSLRLPGIAFTAVSFTPEHPGDGKYADTLVRGIRLQVTDRTRYDPTTTALALLEVIGRNLAHSTHPLFPPARAQFERLLASPALTGAYRSGNWRQVGQNWARADSLFRVRRRPFLLYPE